MRFVGRIRPMSAGIGSLAVLTALTGFNARGQEFIYGVSDELNLLVEFNSATPGTLKSAVSITGLAPGEQMRAIDWVGTTLYGLGSENHLYTINTTTGAVTPVGYSLTPVLNGVNFGLAGSYFSGQLYVASDLGQNLSLNPMTGAATAGPNYTGASLNSIAYNIINGTYIGVSAVTHDLYTISKTTGSETLIGPMGVNFLDRIGLTVSPGSGTAYFSGTVLGSQQAGFYTLNTSTGALTFVGDIGIPGEFTAGLDSITAPGIFPVPEPATEALLAIGGGFGLLLFRRKK